MISPVNGDQLHILAKNKYKFEFGSIFVAMFQIET